MRILLVEEDPEQREPLQAALTRSGQIIDGVADGAIAQHLLIGAVIRWWSPG